MNKYFCCFERNKKTSISYYVEYYSNHDTLSDTSITNSLIDALKDDDEIAYMNNPIHHDTHETVVGGRNPQRKN